MHELILPTAMLLLLAGCGHDNAVPTGEDNTAMDAAANGLDNAAADLDQVDDELPVSKEDGPRAEANGPDPA